MKYLLTASILVACFSITACDSQMASIDKSELRKRFYDCENALDLTAPELQVCKNIKRECQRRQKLGRYEC